MIGDTDPPDVPEACDGSGALVLWSESAGRRARTIEFLMAGIHNAHTRAGLALQPDRQQDADHRARGGEGPARLYR